MSSRKEYRIPCPIVDAKEEKSLVVLTERYNKMLEPGLTAKVGAKLAEALPEQLRVIGEGAKALITEQELYAQAMKVIGEGFNTVQGLVSKHTISKKTVIARVNRISVENQITDIEEICLMREYDLAKLVVVEKDLNLLGAIAEGGTTGWFGFAGIPFNLVLSTFMYYRAVQMVALFYGYDCRGNSSELMIASNVFTNAMSPNETSYDEISSIIGKIMLYAEGEGIKQAAKKTWVEMASRGGIGLLLTQMRALARKSAEKALVKVGQKGLEQSVFKKVFEQIGKKLTLKVVQRSVPVIGSAIGALFDAGQMHKVVEYADVFYRKRFILEKAARIDELIGIADDSIIDIPMEDLVSDFFAT